MGWEITQNYFEIPSSIQDIIDSASTLNTTQRTEYITAKLNDPTIVKYEDFNAFYKNFDLMVCTFIDHINHSQNLFAQDISYTVSDIEAFVQEYGVILDYLYKRSADNAKANTLIRYDELNNIMQSSNTVSVLLASEYGAFCFTEALNQFEHLMQDVKRAEEQVSLAEDKNSKKLATNNYNKKVNIYDNAHIGYVNHLHGIYNNSIKQRVSLRNYYFVEN